MLREFENEKHLLRNTRKLTLFCNFLAYIDLCGFYNFGFEFSFDLCCVYALMASPLGCCRRAKEALPHCLYALTVVSITSNRNGIDLLRWVDRVFVYKNKELMIQIAKKLWPVHGEVFLT